MKRHIAVLFFLSSILLSAQEFSTSYGITKPDLSTNLYTADSTANAIVIYEYGNSFFNKKTFRLNTEIKRKIKILKKEGIENANIEIVLYNNKKASEKVKDIKGKTYNLKNGELETTLLEKTSIYKEKHNDNITIVRFPMPSVSVGSVFTYSYTIESPFMNKYKEWYFQEHIPKLYSEYNTSIPANYEYNIKLVGSLPLNDKSSELEHNCLEVGRGGYSDCTVSKYVMKDIPAFKTEDFMTTKDNYLSRIEYELSVFKDFNGNVENITKTWKSVDQELKDDINFGHQLSKKSRVKKILPESIIQIEDELEKAKAIYQYVLDHYRWNDDYGRYDVSIKELINNKSGSAFEINLLLENLLSREGYAVFPILLSTRSKGLATKLYPVLSDFNYLILKTTINGNDYFIDATNPYLAFGEIPFKCLNQYGRLFDFKNESRWEDIFISEYSTRQYRIQLVLNEEQKLVGTASSVFKSYPSHFYKKMYDESDAEQYLNHLKTRYSNAKIDTFEVLTTNKNDDTFEDKADLVYENEFIGDKVFLNPFIVKFFNKNPFKLQKRTYPIDFGHKNLFVFSMEIDLKDQLRVVEVPEQITLALPNRSGSLIFNIVEKDSKLIVYLKVRFDKAIYGPEYYDALKQFMAKVIEVQNNTLVVLKKL